MDSEERQRRARRARAERVEDRDLADLEAERLEIERQRLDIARERYDLDREHRARPGRRRRRRRRRLVGRFAAGAARGGAGGANAALAFFGGLLIPGFGHFWAGRVGQGLAILLGGGTICAVVVFVAWAVAGLVPALLAFVALWVGQAVHGAVAAADADYSRHRPS